MRLLPTCALLAPFVATAMTGLIARDGAIDCKTYKFDRKDVWGDTVRLLTDDEISAGEGGGGGGGGRKKRDIGGPFWREDNKVIEGIEYFWSAGMDDTNTIEFSSRGFGKTQVIPYQQWLIEVTFKNGAAPAFYWLTSDVTCQRKAGYSYGDINHVYVSRRHKSLP